VSGLLEQQFDFMAKHVLPLPKFESDEEKNKFEIQEARPRFV
jgi:hypothetical protein